MPNDELDELRDAARHLDTENTEMGVFQPSTYYPEWATKSTETHGLKHDEANFKDPNHPDRARLMQAAGENFARDQQAMPLIDEIKRLLGTLSTEIHHAEQIGAREENVDLQTAIDEMSALLKPITSAEDFSLMLRRESNADIRMTTSGDVDTRSLGSEALDDLTEEESRELALIDSSNPSQPVEIEHYAPTLASELYQNAFALHQLIKFESVQKNGNPTFNQAVEQLGEALQKMQTFASELKPVEGQVQQIEQSKESSVQIMARLGISQQTAGRQIGDASKKPLRITQQND